jgi:hypothetical protein
MAYVPLPLHQPWFDQRNDGGRAPNLRKCDIFLKVVLPLSVGLGENGEKTVCSFANRSTNNFHHGCCRKLSTCWNVGINFKVPHYVIFFSLLAPCFFPLKSKEVYWGDLTFWITGFLVNNIYKFGSHLTRNMPSLHYKDQLVNAYREIIAVYCQNHKKNIHTNTLCGQNTKFPNDKSGGTYSDSSEL